MKEQANIYKNAVLRQKKTKEVDIKSSKFIYSHDREFTGITYNCLGIDFKELTEYKQLDIDDAISYIVNKITLLTNEQSGGIGIINIDDILAPYCEEIALDVLVKKIQRLFATLNLPLRNGYEKAYVTFNFGLNTSNSGRKVILAFLKAFESGDLLTKRAFIFPNLVFKIKEGINKSPENKNYDLFLEATKVTSLRMNPTYFNCDNPITDGISASKLGIMGCRTLMGRNIYDEHGAVNRGNIATVSINLPLIANESKNETEFFDKLNNVCNEAKEVLLKKYNLLLENDISNFEFILKNNLFVNSSRAVESESIHEAFKHGSLSLGFLGLFDCISILKKSDMSLEMIKNSLTLAENIMEKMKKLTEEWTETYKLNFSLIAVAGESLCHKFAKNNEVETKDFYTNSFHIPVYIPVSAFEKLEIESLFSRYCNGGSISYIELDAPVLMNKSAIASIILHGIDLGLTYMGINFPLDYCLDCGTTQIFKTNSCSNCSSENIEKIRRVSGYLSTQSSLADGKKQEEKMRVIHKK